MNRLLKLTLTFILLALLVCCDNNKNFNSDEWQSWVESEDTPNTRWLMHKDLIMNYELKGITTNSVIELLGEPNSRNLNEFNYDLGYSERGISTGTLVLIFANDNVTEVKVVEG